MDSLTRYEALLGELEPYSPSSLTLKKALADSDVKDLDQAYNKETDKRPIALAAIKVLNKMLVLESDSLGKASQRYRDKQLENRIADICNENGFDVEQFVKVSSISDGSNLW
ncbi:MAG TPA: hypothetical protein DDW85_01550 [Porphyromonadaceae bacterium]|nr:hypothetical protein [Porphyromonadaceae bacterium]